MKKRGKGNLLITFMMLVALSMAVFSFIFVTTIRLRDAGARTADTKAFLYADAGLNKAIWYLGTPPLSGGKGMTWRVSSTMEPYADGKFLISVQDTGTPNLILVISTGEALGETYTVMQDVSLGGLPDAFKYSIFSQGTMTMNGNDIVYGNLYDASSTMINGSNTIYGDVYHPSGTTITSGGGNTYTDGGPLNPAPTAPAFDNSYYTSLINTAKTYAAGDLNYNSSQTVNLNGGTIYVNGNININYPVTFNGPGTVVTSGSIYYNSTLTANGPVTFVTQSAFNMNNDTNASESTFYTAGALTNNGSARINASSLLSMGDLTLNGTATVNGLIFSEGNVVVQGNTQVNGSICDPKGNVTVNGTVKITYNLGVLPSTAPAGFTPTSIARVKGTWKG